MPELLFKAEAFAIVGAAMDVYNELGNGFLEGVYQDAMEVELGLRSIPFRAQAPLQVTYKGHRLGRPYYPDLLCFEQIIVELKAIQRLGRAEEAQLINYLKATGFHLGILLNFGAPGGLDWQRRVL